jgi:hypothetical protein
LQVDREAAARKMDRAAKALAEALRDLDRAATEQVAALSAAGQASAGLQLLPLPLSIEAALAFAMNEARAPVRMLNLSGAIHGRERPLAESDVRPIEPEK